MSASSPALATIGSREWSCIEDAWHTARANHDLHRMKELAAAYPDQFYHSLVKYAVQMKGLLDGLSKPPVMTNRLASRLSSYCSKVTSDITADPNTHCINIVEMSEATAKSVAKMKDEYYGIAPAIETKPSKE